MSSPLPTWGQMSSPPPTWGQMSSPRPTWGQMSSPRPTWGRPPSAVRPSAARLVSFVQDEKTSRLSVFVSQENHLYHCPRGGRCPHHGPRGDRCPHHGPRGDGRPRPSGRAQLGQSALSQKRNHLGVGIAARKPALPRPTWGRPPSAVRPSAARLVSFVPDEKSSRCRACRKKTSPATAHVGADVLTTAHVGTAALGRPAERSSASQLCPRREIISGVGLCLARKPALPLPTWGQMSSPPPTWGRPPSAVRPSAARLVSFAPEEKSSRVSAFVSQENQPYHCPRGGRCPHHRPRGDGRPRPSGRAQLG